MLNEAESQYRDGSRKKGIKDQMQEVLGIHFPYLHPEHHNQRGGIHSSTSCACTGFRNVEVVVGQEQSTDVKDFARKLTDVLLYYEDWRLGRSGFFLLFSGG